MRATILCWAATLAVLLVIGSAPARADAINASQVVSTLETGFRPENPLAYGQTFTAPPGTTALTSFDVWMGLNPFTGFVESLLPFDARLFVQRWQESDANFGTPVGDLLSISASQRIDVVATRQQPGMIPRVSFAVNAPLIPGQRYVAFISAFGLTDTSTRAGFGLGIMGVSFSSGNNLTFGTDYAGGHFVSGEITGPDATQSNWCRGPGCNNDKLDLAFVARFAEGSSPTPEPSALVLVMTGAVGMLYRRRTRQRPIP